MIDYTTVTEISGEMVSKEQIQRMCNRYFWAGSYVKGKDILEVACGAGQGLNYFASLANQVVAGDISDALVEKAKMNCTTNIDIRQLNAESLPFPDHSFDVIIIFEALYYLAKPELFFKECQRLLKPNGQVLIASANKDLFDFNPSPYSHRYFGVTELKQFLNQYGFKTRFFGDTPIGSVSFKQKLLRPIKTMAVKFNLIPKSMAGKKLLKKLVFGKLMAMPGSISSATMPFIKPIPLNDSIPDQQHKVIFCEATLA